MLLYFVYICSAAEADSRQGKFQKEPVRSVRRDSAAVCVLGSDAMLLTQARQVLPSELYNSSSS